MPAARAQRRLGRQRFQILADGAQVGVGKIAQAVADHLRHRPQRGRLVAGHARLQVRGDFVDRPRAEPGRDVGREVEREPAVDDGAREVLALFDASQEVSRRVAVAAVAESLDQVAAAVPRCALRRIRPVRAFAEVEFAPHAHRPALVERKVKLVHVHRVADGLHRAQVVVDRIDVRARDLRVEVERHRRIHVLAALVHAGMQRTAKVRARPPADAGDGIGRDVGREHRPERRVDAQPARKWCAAGRGVAGNTVAGTRQVLAACGVVWLGEGASTWNSASSAATHAARMSRKASIFTPQSLHWCRSIVG